MSLATPEVLERLQNKLYLKAKEDKGPIARHATILRRLRIRRTGSAANTFPAPWETSVYLEVKSVGEPDAGKPHVRFDERVPETGPRQIGAKAQAFGESCLRTDFPSLKRPRQHSTLPNFQAKGRRGLQVRGFPEVSRTKVYWNTLRSTNEESPGDAGLHALAAGRLVRNAG